MSAPPGFNPDTSLLQQNASAPIVPFRGGGTPVSLEAFYQAILKGQPDTIRKALPESIADITNFAISVEDGKFVLKMTVKGKKKGATEEERDAAAAVEELKEEEAIAAVADVAAVTDSEAKKKEEEEILKKAREFLILEAARAFLRKERNNERKRGTRELMNLREEPKGMRGQVIPSNLKSSYDRRNLQLPSSSEFLQGSPQEDNNSVIGVDDNNDHIESNVENNSELGDLEEADQVIREYEDATNNPPNLNKRKAKRIKILKKALTVIRAARAFGDGVSTAQRKRNSDAFFQEAASAARTNPGASPYLSKLKIRPRRKAFSQQQINPLGTSAFVATGPTIAVRGARTSLSLPPPPTPPSNPAQKP